MKSREEMENRALAWLAEWDEYYSAKEAETLTNLLLEVQREAKEACCTIISQYCLKWPGIDGIDDVEEGLVAAIRAQLDAEKGN